LRFEDATEKSSPLPAHFPVETWNAECLDISKSVLDMYHLEVMGYGVQLDPLTHEGPLLEKGNGNALHDGRILQGPLPVNALQEGKVYQKIVDNRTEDGRPVDMRLVWIRGATPMLYLKYKSESARFSNETVEVSCAEVHEMLSSSERDQISVLMSRLGVDWAELDVLRDRTDGRIYVVDINPTPWGPPAQLPSPEADAAVRLIAAQLERTLTETDVKRTFR
jgi:hypothetical protein